MRKEPPYKFASEYDGINLNLHKVHPPLVGTPSVVRQLGFWIPAELEGADGKPVRRGQPGFRDVWIAHVDAFLAAYFSHIHTQWRGDIDGAAYPHSIRHAASEPRFPGQPDTQDRIEFFRHSVQRAELCERKWQDRRRLELVPYEDPFGKRDESVTFEFHFSGIPVRIRANLKREYFTLTQVVQLSNWRADVPPPEADTEATDFPSRVRTQMNHLEVSVNERWDALKTLANGANPGSEQPLHKDVERYQPLSNFLYQEIWDTLDDALLQPVTTNRFQIDVKLRRNGRLRTRTCPAALGGVFADLRNCAFSMGVEEAWRKPDHHDADNMDHCDPVSKDIVFSNPKRTSLLNFTSDRVFNDRDAILAVDTFLPFLESAPYTSSDMEVLQQRIRDGAHNLDEPLYRMEYAATRFLDGRAIHISSLLGDARPGDNRPLKFLLLFRTRHRWQIGRLVERINHLGTLRMASLMRAARLNEVDHKLREFRLGSYRAMDASDFRAEDYDKAMRDYYRVFETDAAPIGVPPDGPQDRGQDRGGHVDEFFFGLARTTYYIQQFHEILPDLRARSIEGFQPYAEFVRRRIGGTWAMVDSLKDRLDRVAGRLAVLNGQLQANQLVGLSKRNEKQNRRIADLMGLADIAAGLAGIVALSTIFAGLGEEMIAFAFSLADGHVDGSAWERMKSILGRIGEYSDNASAQDYFFSVVTYLTLRFLLVPLLLPVRTTVHSLISGILGYPFRASWRLMRRKMNALRRGH